MMNEQHIDNKSREAYIIKINACDESRAYYSGCGISSKNESKIWKSYDDAKLYTSRAGALVALNHLRQMFPNLSIDVQCVYVCTFDAMTQLDNLQMTYLSQVSLYKSLYEEQKALNKSLFESMKRI